MCHPRVQRTYRSWKHLVVLPPTWPSWSLARKPLSSHPNTGHCPEIHVTLTEDFGAVSLPSHSWTEPLVENMLHDARTGLTKAVVIGPGRAVLFYGRHSMGEGLTMDEARDTTFLLTGAGMLLRKSAYLATDPMTIQEGRQGIAQTVTDCQVKARGARTSLCKPTGPTTLQVFPPRGSPMKDASGDGCSNHQPSPCQPPRGQECNRCQRPKASITLVLLTFPRSLVQEQ